MQHLKILIVEDEVLIAENISDTLNSFGVKEIKMAHDAETVKHMLSVFNPDITLLDIHLENEYDGLLLSENFRQLNIPFIYITSYSDERMVQKIAETKPFAYLSKPLKKSDLFANLLLFMNSITSDNSQQISIKDNGQTFLLQPSRIKYVKSSGNYITVFCDDGQNYVFRQSIELFYQKISDTRFYKPHRSYIINLTKIASYTKKEIIIDDVAVPISRNISGDFIEKVSALKL